MRRHLFALSAVLVLGVLATPAQATVTAIGTGGSDGTRYPVITGDAADDTITVTCGPDANVKINGLDPVAASGTPGPAPIPCAETTSVGASGGAGNDTIDFSAVSRANGFTNPRLCAPCSNNSYAIHAECEGSDGNDTIVSSPIGGAIGGCGGHAAMAGDDLVTGNEGRDDVGLGPGNDRMNGAGGNDFAFGGPGADILRGGAGRDKLFGETGNDTLNGGPSHDRCDGGPGADTASACEVLRGI